MRDAEIRVDRLARRKSDAFAARIPFFSIKSPHFLLSGETSKRKRKVLPRDDARLRMSPCMKFGSDPILSRGWETKSPVL